MNVAHQGVAALTYNLQSPLGILAEKVTRFHTVRHLVHPNVYYGRARFYVFGADEARAPDGRHKDVRPAGD
jgi:hypothetical protein